MSYSATANSPLFYGAQANSNSKSQQAYDKELKASHHLIRNNPVVRVGALRFRASCIGNGAKPVFDSKLYPDEFIEEFKYWMDYCDFHEQSNFAGVQALATLTAVVEGRAFIVRRRTIDRVPLRLEVVSPLAQASNLEKSGKNSYIKSGILYSKNGKVQKYAFYKLPPDHDDFDEESVNWISASDVIDLKDIHHPGQSTAQPWITAGADFAQQYKDNQTVEIKSRMKRQAQQVYALRDSDTSQNVSLPGSVNNSPPKKKLVHKAGGVTILDGVKDIKTASPPEMSGNYQEHNNQVLRMIAGLLGITYETLTGDLTQVNYSSIRAGMINHRLFIGQLRTITLEPAFNKVIGWFCEAWQLTLYPDLDDYFDNPYKYTMPTFIWPEWEEIDPLKAAKALALELNSDITSMEKVANSRGATLNQHLDSVERSKDAINKRGLSKDESFNASDDVKDDADDS